MAKSKEAATAPDKDAAAPADPSLMATVAIDQVPYALNGAPIKELRIKSIRFRHFVDAVEAAEAARASSKNKAGFRKELLRQRRAQQIKAVTADGVEHAIPPETMGQMPTVYAVRASAVLEAAMEEDGEIIAEGDGQLTAIVYRLGTPIALIDKNNGAGEIAEIEIIAPNLNAIEDVLAAETGASQALALLRKCARPVPGGPGSPQLFALTDWMVDQITIVDGLTIMEKIVPRFFEAPAV